MYIYYCDKCKCLICIFKTQFCFIDFLNNTVITLVNKKKSFGNWYYCIIMMQLYQKKNNHDAIWNFTWECLLKDGKESYDIYVRKCGTIKDRESVFVLIIILYWRLICYHCFHDSALLFCRHPFSKWQYIVNWNLSNTTIYSVNIEPWNII